MKITIQDFLHRLNDQDPDVFKDFVENLAIALYHPEPPEWGHTYEDGPELGIELDSDNEFPSGADILGHIHDFFLEQGLLRPETPPTYTVVGIYADNNQRYCDDFTAWSPTNAEAQARARAEADGNELIVAGVFLNGKLCIPDGEG